MPVENLHCVPDNVTDQEACFTEPLAAACRIVEQQVRQCPHQASQVWVFRQALPEISGACVPPATNYQSGQSGPAARPVVFHHDANYKHSRMAAISSSWQ